MTTWSRLSFLGRTNIHLVLFTFYTHLRIISRPYYIFDYTHTVLLCVLSKSLGRWSSQFLGRRHLVTCHLLLLLPKSGINTHTHIYIMFQFWTDQLPNYNFDNCLIKLSTRLYIAKLFWMIIQVYSCIIVWIIYKFILALYQKWFMCRKFRTAIDRLAPIKILAFIVQLWKSSVAIMFLYKILNRVMFTLQFLIPWIVTVITAIYLYSSTSYRY